VRPVDALAGRDEGRRRAGSQVHANNSAFDRRDRQELPRGVDIDPGRGRHVCDGRDRPAERDAPDDAAVHVGDVQPAGAVYGEPDNLAEASPCRGTSVAGHARRAVPRNHDETLPSRVPAEHLVPSSVRDEQTP
jgi:hypothetical protein